jgi:hypothetical protein
MTDYKNKYIKYKLKYLNLIGGMPSIEIDLKSCTKLSYFKKNPQTFNTKEDLEKYNFDSCVINIEDKHLKDICKILFNLISEIHDFVMFINIFKDEPRLKLLLDSVFKIFESFSFKFDLLNLLIFLYNFIDFLKKFIENINLLLKKIYEININILTITDHYFLLNLQGNRSVTSISINIFISVFKRCYDTIFSLILQLKNKFEPLAADYAYKKVLFDNFNKKFKENMLTLYRTTKNIFDIPFIEYEQNLRNKILIFLQKIEDQLKGTMCNDFLSVVKELQISNTKIEDLVKKFLLLMDKFVCIKDKRADIFNNLKEIGIILKFLSIPEDQKKIEEKLKTMYDSFSKIQKTLFVKDVNTDYTRDLLEKLDLLEGKLLLCLGADNNIFIDFKEFKDNLHPTNISEVNISKLTAFYTKLKEFIKSTDKCDTKSNIKKTQLGTIAIDIRKILETNRFDKSQEKKSILSRLLRRKKYKIVNLKLIGGVNYANIELKSCSKFSFYKEKKNLFDNFQFKQDTFVTKKSELNKHNIEICIKKIISDRNFNKNFKAICMTLLNLVSELDDFVQFIQIFVKPPFNQEFKVIEITQKFNSFNFELDLHKLPNFLQNFYIFLKDFVEKINILFKDVLSKNKNIFELDFMKFKYFALSLEDFSVFHNQTFVKCPIFFKVFRERYDKIFELIKKLTDGLTDIMIEILVNDFQLYREIDLLYLSSIDIFKKTIVKKEKNLRVGISPICDEILKSVKLPPECYFSLKLMNLKKDSDNIQKSNDEIIDKFLDLLDTFCIKENRPNILTKLKNIGKILKELANDEQKRKIEEKIEGLESNQTFSEKVKSRISQIFTPTSYAEELKSKLEILEKNLLLCFNGQGVIFNTFTTFKNKIQITNIKAKDIEELDEINKLLTPFIKKSQNSCKIKRDIASKKELQTQLLNIREILQQNRSVN